MRSNRPLSIAAWPSVIFCGLYLAFTLPLFAAGGPADALHLVQRTTNDLLQKLNQSRADIARDQALVYDIVRDVVMPEVDVPRISRLVLGKHWRSLSERHQHEFQNAFAKLLTRTYAAALVENSDALTVRYLSATQSRSGRYFLVRTEVLRPGAPPLAVTYRLSNQDAPKLVDTTVEGVSLVATYRTTFSSKLRSGGIASLLLAIDEKTREADRQNQALRTAGN